MVIFITGGSASGKSAYAGRLAEKIAEGNPVRYIATMPEQGREAAEKIRRHEALRQNGNYRVSVCLSFSALEAAAADPGDCPVTLLDSLDGFLADVFFDVGEDSVSSGTAAISVEDPAAVFSSGSVPTERRIGETEKRLTDIIVHMTETAGHLILVTDDMYRDGMSYDPETERFIESAGRICRKAANRADAVLEVICGIPVPLKLPALPAGKTGPAAGERSEPDNKYSVTEGTAGEWNEFFEIPDHHDVPIYPSSHAAD